MKNRSLIYIFLFFLSTSQVLAQIPNTPWSKTFGGIAGEYGSAVRQTIDGGYIIVGSTTSFGAGGSDVWLIKTDIMGNKLWTKTIGGPSNERGSDIQQTADSGYIITGYTDVDWYDLLLIKTNSIGDTIWTKTYGAYGGNSVQQTRDGGYIVGGTKYSDEPPHYRAWLLKTDALGDLRWSKQYDGGWDTGGSSVQQTFDSGYILVGSANLGEDLWLLKTDSLGNEIWSKHYGNEWGDGGSSVQQTSDSGYIITGYTESTEWHGDRNLLLIKTSSSGDTLWTRAYGDNELDNWGGSVQQCKDGGYIITGSTQSPIGETGDLWLLKTDSSGDTIWTRTFGGPAPDAGYSVQQTIQGGYIITGFTESFGMGGADVWLINYPEPPVGVIDEILVNDFILEQNYPNPFNPGTTIRYSIPTQSNVKLRVYNSIGENISDLINANQNAGSYEVSWVAENFASGIYFYSVEAIPSDGTKIFRSVRKMILLK